MSNCESFNSCLFLVFSLNLAPCKVIQESLGFRIPRCGFRIPCLWIPDFKAVDSGFHNQQPGFWITIMVGFRIPLAGFRIPKPWIPDSTDQIYLDSGLRITLHGAINQFILFNCQFLILIFAKITPWLSDGLRLFCCPPSNAIVWPSLAPPSGFVILGCIPPCTCTYS